MSNQYQKSFAKDSQTVAAKLEHDHKQTSEGMILAQYEVQAEAESSTETDSVAVLPSTPDN